MDQETLFQEADMDLLDRLRPQLLSVISKNWLDKSLLMLEKRKGYYSIKYNGSVVAKIGYGKKPYLELSAIGPYLFDERATGGNIKISLARAEEAYEYCSMIETCLQATLDATPKVFSCCSRYMQCSDNMACIHPDMKMRMDCGYRKILASGKCFYGVNRNIE